MLKKAKAGGGAPQGDQIRQLAGAVMDSSHRIWLAGLGAFSKAQQEGMKVFDTLVKEGEALESQTRKVAASTAGAATSAARSKAKEMQAMAGGTWDRLEQVFEERVARALHRLGMYRSSDFQTLAERVNALSEAVNDLLAKSGPGGARGAKRGAGGRAAGAARKAKAPKAGAPGARRKRSSTKAAAAQG